MADIISVLTPEVSANIAGLGLYGALALLGAAIGLLTGLFGVGGGFLTVPMMNIVLGVPYELAVGSDLSMIVGTSTAGVLRHRDAGTIDVHTAWFIGSGSIVGAIAGDVLQDFVRGFANPQGFTLAMHALFLALLVGAVVLTTRPLRATATTAGQNQPAGLVYTRRRVRYPALALIGVSIGVLTGMMGIGGGVLLVPVLLAIVGLPERTAAGTSLLIVLLSASVATIKKTMSPLAKVSLPVALALLAGGVTGVQLGVFLGRRLPGKQFRKYYGYVLIAAMAAIFIDIANTLFGGFS